MESTVLFGEINSNLTELYVISKGRCAKHADGSVDKQMCVGVSNSTYYS